MKKKICFVGFSGEELESLQAALPRVAGIWDCVFFPEGSLALVAMGAGPVDAVVACAGKGSLDGAEFMHQAAAQQPRVLRLILGHVADQELIISCIGATHQFIARPCKPEDLIWTVQRALSLDACMSSDQIRALAPKLRRLPSMPATYFEVLKQVESASATVQSVGEVIMRDPAITARLLQMVNSAAFALAQKVTDPMDAVSLLGMETVKSLVLCLQVFSQNEAAKYSGVSLDQIWEHSLNVARIAREITLFQTGDPLQANEAFTAGLLHDVGRIVMASNLPKEYVETVKAAKEQARPLHVQEAAQFGVHHAQVGAYLLGLWGMPAAFVEAAALHHAPSRTPAHEFSLLTAVHVADVFAHENDKSGLVQPKLDPNYMSALGLDGQEAIWKEIISGEKVLLEKDRNVIQAKALPRKSEAAPAPAPVETSRTQYTLFDFLMPAAAVIILVASMFLWQYANHSGDTVRALARTDADTNAAAPADAGTDISNAPVVKTCPLTPLAPDAPAAPATPAAPADSMSPVAPAVSTPKPEAEPSTLLPVAQAPKSGESLAVTGGFDSVKLEGILVGDLGSSVIFNGKTLSVGDSINGVMVEAIDSTGVTATFNGQQKIIKVK